MGETFLGSGECVGVLGGGNNLLGVLVTNIYGFLGKAPHISYGTHTEMPKAFARDLPPKLGCAAA